jgi:hypothetical protein
MNSKLEPKIARNDCPCRTRARLPSPPLDPLTHNLEHATATEEATAAAATAAAASATPTGQQAPSLDVPEAG